MRAGVADRPEDFELEVVPGLEALAAEELARATRRRAGLGPRAIEGRIPFRYAGNPRDLEGLRRAVAVHLVLTFPVPRPRALLGHQNLTRLLGAVRSVVDGDFRTFHLSAAGADSPVLRALRQAIADATGLADAPTAANLQLALRREVPPGAGWQLLVRTMPRPLSARAWRACDMPGALNATIASAMLALAGVGPRTRLLNAMCGSGTLLAEALDHTRPAVALGVDRDADALAGARRNLARWPGAVALVRGDAAALPCPDHAVDAIVVDLPWGQLTGVRGENETLYPAFLHEAARVAAPNATLVAISADRATLERALRQASAAWRSERTVPLRIPFRNGYVRSDIVVARRR